MCATNTDNQLKMPSNFRYTVPQAPAIDAGASFLKRVKPDVGVNPAILLVERWRCCSTSQNAQGWGGEEMFVRKVTH